MFTQYYVIVVRQFFCRRRVLTDGRPKKKKKKHDFWESRKTFCRVTRLPSIAQHLGLFSSCLVCLHVRSVVEKISVPMCSSDVRYDITATVSLLSSRTVVLCYHNKDV